MSIIWSVAVNAPINQCLSYAIPLELQDRVRSGISVQVPLGRRTATGVLIEKVSAPINVDLKIKEIQKILEDRPILNQQNINWLTWLSSYYVYPIGQVFDLSFAPLDKATKKSQRSKKSPIFKESEMKSAPQHTLEQKKVIDAIAQEKDFSTHLIFGVTGSGKTEIYISLLEKQIAEKKQAIVLVPEISLTPQLIDRFSARLGQHIAAIHSHLSPREKTNQWWDAYEKRKQVLIGARSALFCPIENLGLIILDEEHESSYKQDEKLKYHARDAAIMLGKYHNCPVILGSATPSLETWNNCLQSKFKLHELKQRVENRPMPEVKVIDIKKRRDEQKQAGTTSELPFWLSEELYTQLQLTYNLKEQSALFLNRRGIAQSVVCPSCGQSCQCPNCAVSLTLHSKNHLVCHYCDFRETLPNQCPKCLNGTPKAIGIGTELISNDLEKLFPSANVLRMDRDEIVGREDLEKAIEEIESGFVDFIVGTQMIAKGLDFEKLTCVGIVLADVAFNLPDFRASERSFQLLTQVSGRAGRHLKDRKGQVIIQTYNPEHPSIEFAQNQDYRGFADLELSFRNALAYPPCGKLSVLRIQALDQNLGEQEILKIRKIAHAIQLKFKVFENVEILGPAPAPLFKIRNKFRYQLLIKASNSQQMSQYVQKLMATYQSPSSRLSLSLDVDAVNLL